MSGDRITVIDRPVKVVVKTGGGTAGLLQHLANPEGAHEASAINFAPYDFLVEDDVQSNMQLLADAFNAIPPPVASAVGFTPAAGIVATDVQAAIEELVTDIGIGYVTLGTAQTITGAKTFGELTALAPSGVSVFADAAGQGDGAPYGNFGYGWVELVDGNFSSRAGMSARIGWGQMFDGASYYQGSTGGTWYTGVLASGGYVINHNNNSTEDRLLIGHAGPVTIKPHAAAGIGLIVKGQAAQSASLQEWRNSADAVMAKVFPSGASRFTTAIDLDGTTDEYIGLYANGNYSEVFGITGAASYDLWADDVNPSSVTGLSLWRSGADVFDLRQGLGTAPSLRTSRGLVVSPWAGTTVVPLAVKGAASQSANLFEARNSADAVLASIYSTGAADFGGTVRSVGASGNVESVFGNVSAHTGDGTTVTIGRIGPASQSGLSLQDAIKLYRDAAEQVTLNGGGAAGTRLSIIGGSYPNLVVGTSVFSNYSGSGSLGTIDTLGYAYQQGTNISEHRFTIGAAAGKFAIVGAASQTGNLTEWRNSAGTALTKVDAAGDIFVMNGNFGRQLRMSRDLYGAGALGLVAEGTNPVFYIANDGGGALAFRTGGNTRAYVSGTTDGFQLGGAGDVSVYRSAARQLTIASSDAIDLFDVLLASPGGSSPLRYERRPGGFFSGAPNGAELQILGTAGATPSLVISENVRNVMAMARSATDVPFTAKGVAAQAAYLTRWDNSAGSMLANVNEVGGAMFSGDVTFGSRLASTAGAINGWIDFSGANGAVRVIGYNNTWPAFVVNTNAAGTTATVSSRSFSSGTGLVTLTTSANHGFSPGQVVTISGLGATYDGAFVINTTPTATTFTYFSIALSNLGPTASAGTAIALGSTVEHRENNVPVIRTFAHGGGGWIFGNPAQNAQVVSMKYDSANGQLVLRDHAPYNYGKGTLVIDSNGIQNRHGLILSNQGAGISGLAISTPSANFYLGAPNGGEVPLYMYNTVFTVTGNYAGTPPAGKGIFNVVGISTTIPEAVVRAVASQTADVQQWQNSAAAVLARVDSAGSFRTTGFGAFGSDSNLGSILASTSTLGGVPAATLSGGNAAAVLAVKLNSVAYSGDLQQWRDSADSVLGLIDSTGAFGRGTDSNSWRLGHWAANGRGYNLGGGVSPNNALIQGDTGAGRFVMSGGESTLVLDKTTGLQFSRSGTGQVSFTVQQDRGIIVQNWTAANVASIIKGAASQTANLTEWRNSADAVLARVNSAGTIVADQGILLPTAGSPSSQTSAIQGPSGARFFMNGANNWVISNSGGGAIATFTDSQSADFEGQLRANIGQRANLDTLELIQPSATGSNNRFIRFDNGAAGELGYFSRDLAAYWQVQSASAVPLTLKGHASQTADLFQAQNSASTVLASILASGLHKWSSGNEQTTVGIAGGAAVIPLSPTKYLKVVDSAGTTLVIPAFASA